MKDRWQTSMQWITSHYTCNKRMMGTLMVLAREELVHIRVFVVDRQTRQSKKSPNIGQTWNFLAVISRDRKIIHSFKTVRPGKTCFDKFVKMCGMQFTRSFALMRKSSLRLSDVRNILCVCQLFFLFSFWFCFTRGMFFFFQWLSTLDNHVRK